MRVIGLTGGIGSGKSTVSDFFVKHGVPVVCADKLSRAMLEVGHPVHDTIVRDFPVSIFNPDMTINRRELGALVMEHDEWRIKLEGLIHPRVAEGMRDAVVRFTREGHPAVVYDAPLLMEAGHAEGLDAIVVVYAPPELQLQRALARGRQTEVYIKAAMMLQMSWEERKRRATHVIDNGGSLEETERQVVAFIEEVIRPPQSQR